jgi:hypothetical protein
MLCCRLFRQRSEDVEGKRGCRYTWRSLNARQITLQYQSSVTCTQGIFIAASKRKNKSTIEPTDPVASVS